MPVQACALNGKPGYQWGDAGTCYTYNEGNEASRVAARQQATVQGQQRFERESDRVRTKMRKESVDDDAAKQQAKVVLQKTARKRGHDLSDGERRSLLSALGDVVRCKVGEKMGVKYPGGTCFTYDPSDPDTEGEARARAAQEGERIRVEKSRRLAQPGVHGVHSSKPLQRAGDKDGTKAPAYAKAEVDYGPGKGEQECGNCRFFSDGKCSLVKGTIDSEAWCRLFSPEDVQDLEREDEDDKKAKRLTEAQLTAFYELKDVKLDDVQGARRSWVPIFPEGHFSHPEYGDLDFTLGELRKYVLNFRKRVRKIDIAVDIDHKNEDAVGWLKDVDLRAGVGLFGLVEWNQHGAGLIADKRYRYISPQFGEYVDEESGTTYDPVIVALTITNFPFLKSMAAVSLRKKEGSRPTVTGRDKMATTSTRLKRADDELADLDDDEAKEADDDGDDSTLRKAKKAKKAKKAMGVPDDKEAIDGDSDDAMQSSELDDDEEMKGAAKLYDEDDIYDDESNDQFEGQSRGDTHPENVSKGKPGAYAAPAKGKSSSEPRDEIRRLTEANRTKDRRLRALEMEMEETRRTLRMGAVREQVRKLSDGAGKKLSFTKPVMDEFKKLALSDKEAGNSLFRILSLVQRDGLVSLSIQGRASDPDDERDDPTGHGPKVLRDKKTGKLIVGLNEQKRAQMYASEHKLNWDDGEDRLKAYLAISGSDEELSDDDSYTREV